MRARGVHLEYSFQSDGQRGADVHNPLFELLSALRDHGSIQHAAKSMGASYRHVWGALKHWENVLGEPLVSWTQGQPARLTPFAHRMVWAEARARARLTPHIEALRVELERVLSEALDGTQQVVTLYASHDLALPLLRERAGAEARLHVELRFAGSVDALRALTEGRCVVAGFHVPKLSAGGKLFEKSLKPLLKPGRHKLIGCATRRQGLIVARGNPHRIGTLHDLTRGGLRFVNRQSGSGTRLLTDQLLQSERVDPSAIAGYADSAEDSHLAVAAAVASGSADAGMGIEAAARSYGLEFVPLADEDYFLVCLRDALDQPPVMKLREVLAGATWQQALLSLPGYGSDRAGQVLSLTKALPWWTFRVRKRRHVSR
ncbi:MAG TPA: substrate-binding domain-containing protein [Burkholderiaceae bacterium]|nr:substrate-binding domain-containing protein [Burkholderiaceae bacterium]